jgi:hypothetical protein
MKTYMHILSFLLSALLLYGCDSTEPDKDKHPNIIWKIYNFGTFDSRIRDIFVINENNIWTVGQMHDESTDQYDSLGNWKDPYNVGVWNGEKWEFRTIYFQDKYFAEQQSIWALNENDVWFGYSGAYTRWNENSFTYFLVPNVQGPETRVWGNSNNILFLADNIGTIAYYDGTGWKTKIKYEAKTISDFWGVNGYNTFFACYDYYSSSKNQVFKIEADKAFDLGWDSTKVPYNLWTNETGRLWVAAFDGLYKYENQSWQTINFQNSFNAINVRGTSQENIYVVGSDKLVAHFNGISWQNYDIGFNGNAVFNTLSVTPNTIALAGFTESGLIIAVGKIQ